MVFSFIFTRQSNAIINRDLLFDLKDILSEKLMPMSILQIKRPNDDTAVDTIPSRIMFEPASFVNIDSALRLMQFHRDMIQNFKCKNYLAKNILIDVAPFALQDRLGIANTDSNGKKYCAISIRVYYYLLFYKTKIIATIKHQLQCHHQHNIICGIIISIQ